MRISDNLTPFYYPTTTKEKSQLYWSHQPPTSKVGSKIKRFITLNIRNTVIETLAHVGTITILYNRPVFVQSERCVSLWVDLGAPPPLLIRISVLIHCWLVVDPFFCATGDQPVGYAYALEKWTHFGRNWADTHLRHYITASCLFALNQLHMGLHIDHIKWALVWIGGGGVILGEIWPPPRLSRRLYNTHTLG